MRFLRVSVFPYTHLHHQVPPLLKFSGVPPPFLDRVQMFHVKQFFWGWGLLFRMILY